ncbi:FecCD family ABC transporter permease [Nonomuraea typhae]|uniref:FecCD family ABC transporter permease n=1 Tax=Nonomuraea typhae TaxID=2603600 RepID=UPI001FE49948|nr:iron chelate uptake ABC transporter family permease subunit [Nonomuraea typhae]
MSGGRAGGAAGGQAVSGERRAGVWPAGRLLAFRLPRPAVSGLVRLRVLLVWPVLALLAFAVFCLAVGAGAGDITLTPGELLPALWGRGEPATLFLVHELRLPRAVVAALAGAAFGMAGALFQAITRNPLASPDMLGITQGAGTAVVAAIVLGTGQAASGTGTAQAVSGAGQAASGGFLSDLGALGDLLAGLSTQALGLIGALAAGLLIYALAWNRGTTGYRIVLVGIGVSWICVSITYYLLSRAEQYQAARALGWLVGNLNDRGWAHARPLALALVVLVPAALLLTRHQRTLQLGDEVARSLGVPVQRARMALLLCGCALAAFATAAAGPVLFVALAAPQVARRLTGAPMPPLTASAFTGATLVVVSDLVSQRLLTDSVLPVGVVTGVLGAPFLLWHLSRAKV